MAFCPVMQVWQFKRNCDSESQDIDVADFNEGVKVNEHCSYFLNSWVH